jgi:hypothetical protein
MKTCYWNNCAILLLVGVVLGLTNSIACEQNPGKISIAVSGAQAGSDQNYYVVEIPEQGTTTVTITGSGQTPCPTDQEKCKCTNASVDPETDGDPKYTFTKTVGNQDPTDGPTVKWDVSSSANPGEYKFKVTKIEQAYKACPQGLTGGVTSKSNTQESDEVTVLAYKIETETVASTPADKTRKKLGVGEEVNLTYKPTSITVNWSVEGNKGSVSPPTSATTKYTAHNEAAEGKVKAEFKGINKLTSFNVVEPSGEIAAKQSDKTWPSGVQGAGMYLDVTVKPADVSFYNVEVLEVDKGTVNVSGYFTNFSSSALKHHPNPKWIQLTDENKWADHAWFYGWGAPWKQGTYQWNIDVLWRVAGSTGSGKKFNLRTQLHEIIDSTGKSQESKMSVSSTRSP